MVETVILDACCTLNLAASGRIAEILGQLTYAFCIGRRASGEAQWLAKPESEEREWVDLQPLIAVGLLSKVQIDSSVEEALFVELSATLADGEAEAAALAVHRGYIFATDDRKARRITSERRAGIRLTSTLELLQEWQQATMRPNADMAGVLRLIAQRATYRPRTTDSLWAWWASLVEER